jgi:Flp pilus assembly protein TadD
VTIGPMVVVPHVCGYSSQAIIEHKPVDVDATAAEAFIVSGFVHRLAVMNCVQEDPPSGLAISHERKATASFTAATQLGVKNLQESIGMMESEIQRAPKVRVIIEAFARSQPMQQVMAKQQPGGSSKDTESKQVKKEIRLGSDAFKAEDYVSAVSHFSKALAMKPSQKWLKWLYKNRAVCYKHTKQWEQMAADAHESCKLEEAVPENYLR